MHCETRFANHMLLVKPFSKNKFFFFNAKVEHQVRSFCKPETEQKKGHIEHMDRQLPYNESVSSDTLLQDVGRGLNDQRGGARSKHISKLNIYIVGIPGKWMLSCPRPLYLTLETR